MALKLKVKRGKKCLYKKNRLLFVFEILFVGLWRDLKWKTEKTLDFDVKTWLWLDVKTWLWPGLTPQLLPVCPTGQGTWERPHHLHWPRPQHFRCFQSEVLQSAVSSHWVWQPLRHGKCIYISVIIICTVNLSDQESVVLTQ